MTNEQRRSLAEKTEAYTEKAMAAKKICPTCKHIIECDIDKQAFYKFTDKQCEEYKPDLRTKKKCRYRKYTKRLENRRFDCNDCPIEKSLNSILEKLKEDGYGR